MNRFVYNAKRDVIEDRLNGTNINLEWVDILDALEGLNGRILRLRKKINMLIYENNQLQQSQNSKAIEVLERLRNFYNSDSDSDWLIDCCKLDEYIDNQIIELRGGENESE